MEDLINKTKEELNVVLESLSSISVESYISSSNDLLLSAKSILNKVEYNVVVCGEVKQGKTSFINAILGQNLLPVAAKVATSQVFCISNAEKESFYLVFDNGHKEPITRDEMVRYGTETGENLENDPLIRGRSLRWIEVNVPTHYLPHNVHLLDTPGLGALYQQHAIITHKYIALADAVIFVKEAKDPIVAQERDFLKKVLEITPNVMFVHSKCDLYDEDARENLAKRCEEIITKEFSSQLGNKVHFWPISSQNHFDAMQEQDAEARAILEEVSGFKAMFKELQLLLFRATGYKCVSSSYISAYKVYQSIASSLIEQKRVLSLTDVNEKQKLQKEKLQKQQEFTKLWGNGGSQLREVNEKITQIISLGQNRLHSIFAAGGEIRQRFIKEIEQLDNSKKIFEEYSQKLPDVIIDAICKKWREIEIDTYNRLSSELDKYDIEISSSFSKIKLDKDYDDIHLSDNSRYIKIRNLFMGGTFGSSVAGIAGEIAFTLLGGPVGLVVGLGLTGAGLITGAIAGNNESKSMLAKNNKNILNNYVNNFLSKLQLKLCIEPQDCGRTYLQEFCDNIKRIAQDSCKRIAEREKAKLDEEISMIEQAVTSNIASAKENIEKIDKYAQELSVIKDKLTFVYDTLKNMDNMLKQ